ncbi:MAG TPA: response regulator transcription factor [Steroidobacteraceae bacterium]|nr:response regulator transcription factor [Steroidobacteraceae bacterium]
MKERHPIVYIVDDDSGARVSLRSLLKSVGITATAYPSARDFLATYQTSDPGCLLLDVRMPGMSGLELQMELNLRGATIPVVFLTGHGDVPMAVEAMQHGAFDFLQKPYREQALLDCVQRAMAKDRVNREALEEHEFIRANLNSLTAREREVLDLMILGKSNKTMAAELSLSQRTVEIHRANVMEKMAADSVAQLVRMVIEVEKSGP